MTAPRATLVLGIAAAYAAAVFSHPQPATMALGLAPLAWIALEAGWCLFDRDR